LRGLVRQGKQTGWLRVALFAASLLFVAAAMAYWALRPNGDGHPIVWTPPGGTMHHEALAVRTLGEHGTPILLLHGLVGSQLFWGGPYDRLSRGHRLIAPDLLGFGASPHPESAYSADDQVDALARTLKGLGVHERMIVVGHSLGSLIAIRMAARYPDMVSSVICFSPPLYPDREDAKQHIARMGLFEKFFALDTPFARALCQWECDHREWAAPIAELLAPELPRAITRDSVNHTPASYFGTMEGVILAARGGGWLENIHIPVVMVAGDSDEAMDLDYLGRLAKKHSNVLVSVLRGYGHNFPLSIPATCIAMIEKAADQPSASGRVPRTPTK
jgi:pimeloyl-ACP methyl ester carboxylesterase